MRAGQRNKLIEIHSFTITEDDFGQVTKTYSLLKTVWAGVKSISETEPETGGKYEGRSIYEFKLRYTSLSKLDRIVWNGMNFEISEILNVRQRNTELIVRAVSDA